jgi:hypothetical protein
LSLATAIVEGDIPSSLTTDQLVDLVQATGGLDIWALKNKHEFLY